MTKHSSCPLARLLLLLLLVLTGSQETVAQQPVETAVEQKAVSYTFVSPNTRENLTLDDAVKLLNSPEELRLMDDIRSLSQCIGAKPSIWKAVGSWSDGAEHSAVFRVFLDHSSVLYEAAQLGKVQRQKSVLFFRQSAPGAGRMYVLALRRKLPLASISRLLDKSGVMFRTLVPVRKRPAVVYVVDLENKLRMQILAAARTLRARVMRIKGFGSFIGDDTDREKAQTVYLETIKKYEVEHPDVARKCAR